MGSIPGPRCGQSLFGRATRACMSPSPDPDLCVFPALLPMMPILSFLPYSEYPHPRPYSPEVLCCLSVPIPPCCPDAEISQPFRIRAAWRPAGWGRPSPGQACFRTSSAPLHHWRLSLQKLPGLQASAWALSRWPKGSPLPGPPGETSRHWLPLG